MSVNAVKCMILKFEKIHSLDVAPGRGRWATDPVVLEEVAIATAEASANSSNATVSGRSIAPAFDIQWATVRMTLRNVLKHYPYKMHIIQQLKPQDYSARVYYALRYLLRMQVDEYRPSHILWTDEAHLHLDGAEELQHMGFH